MTDITKIFKSHQIFDVFTTEITIAAIMVEHYYEINDFYDVRHNGKKFIDSCLKMKKTANPCQE